MRTPTGEVGVGRERSTGLPSGRAPFPQRRVARPEEVTIPPVRLKLQPTTDPHAYDAAVRDLPITSALQGWGYGEARRTLGQ